MNDEIKEILNKWKCYIELTKKFTTNEYEMLRVEDIDKILDYITNLQQENERLKGENNNKAMNDYAHAIDESWYRELYDDYKSRCEKAIEYIQNKNNITKHGIYPNYTYEVDTKDLLNILQNGSEKE